MMFKIVPSNEWILELTDKERSGRLLNPMSPEDIIDSIVNSIEPHSIQSRIVSCNNRDGFSRYEAEAIIPKDLYDLLFHGCSGYRAQYYSGMEYGENYNKRLVRRLFPILVRHEIEHPHLSLIAGSLLQTDSKVTWYNNNDGILYYSRNNILQPARWLSYWNLKSTDPKMGLKDLLLENCRLFIKGTFIDVVGNIHISKPNRARELYESGWT